MRTFIAIDLPFSIQQQLMSYQQMLKPCVDAASVGHAVRWTPVANTHLTLRFLGETSDAQRAELHATLTAIAASQAHFELALNDLGCFPDLQRPAVIWVGIGGDLTALNALQMQIETAVCAAGFQPETRTYSPHLTIARVQRRAKHHTRRDVGATIQHLDSPIPTASFRVRRIDHVRSIFKPTGTVYTPLAQFRFVEA